MKIAANPYADPKDFRLPDVTKRTVVIGRTGSGKTKFMRYLLSKMPVNKMPWIIFDYKQSGDFDDIPWAKKIDMKDLPEEPGVYILSPKYGDDDNVDAKLFSILERGRTGVLFDEGTSVPQREPRFLGLKSILAQGRGKRVPCIFGTQRPRHVNKSLMSEGDFFAVFHLSYDADRQALAEFVPDAVSTNRLDDYYSHWYDTAKDRLFILPPVNDVATLERFDDRLQPRRRLI